MGSSWPYGRGTYRLDGHRVAALEGQLVPQWALLVPVLGEAGRVLGQTLRVHHPAELAVQVSGCILDRDQHRPGQTLYPHGRFFGEYRGRSCGGEGEERRKTHISEVRLRLFRFAGRLDGGSDLAALGTMNL